MAEYRIVKEVKCYEREGKCRNLVGHVCDVDGATYVVPLYYFAPPSYDISERGILPFGDFKKAVRLSPNVHGDDVELADYAGETILFPGICRDPKNPDSKRGRHDGITHGEPKGVMVPPGSRMQRARSGMVLIGDDLADPDRSYVRAVFPDFDKVLTKAASPAMARLHQWVADHPARMSRVRERQERNAELWPEWVQAQRDGDRERAADLYAEMQALDEANKVDRQGPPRPFPVEVEWTPTGPSALGSPYDIAFQPSLLMRQHTTTNRVVGPAPVEPRLLAPIGYDSEHKQT